MPSQPPAKKVLIIGAGPVRIGQSAALDDAACQACAVFKAAGIETVMVHCDPSARSADVNTADRTYLLPLTVQSLTDVIAREQPDALLPTVGGPVALRLAAALAAGGVLTAAGMRLMGIDDAGLAQTGDPSAFFAAAEGLGLAVPEGRMVDSIADAADAAETMGYPVFVRVAAPDGRIRYGAAFNVEELRLLASGGRLPTTARLPMRIESALSGCREIEVELLRDAGNRLRIVAVAENMDPVGIHSGDSTVAIPPLTVDADLFRRIEAAALILAGGSGICGALHVKFAVEAENDRLRVMAMDPCFSRTTSLCTRILDIPLAAVHARLALGMPLDDALGEDAGALNGATDSATAAVRLPCWEFDRFAGTSARLGARMQSTGDVLGLGSDYPEALLSALCTRSPYPDAGPAAASVETLLSRLAGPGPDRLPIMVAALKKGAAPQALAEITGIARAWIDPLAERIGRDAPPAAETASDRHPCPAAAGSAPRIWFHTAHGKVSRHTPLEKSVLIVGPSRARIGQGIELDHGCIQAADALHAAGRSAVLASANPTSAVALDAVERTYVAPLTAADITAVCRSEAPEGVILQFGGYAAMRLAGPLTAAGYTVLGTDDAVTCLTQDRHRFDDLLTELGIPHPQIGEAQNPDAAMDLAEAIGYPLVATPLGRRTGRPRTIVMDAPMLERFLMTEAVTPEQPLLLEQFLEYAIEVEADALCDGSRVYVPAVMEHIELAGVHPGDATMVVPPYSTPPRHVETIAAIVNKVARRLGVNGLLNSRFAVYNDTVYLLGVRPWACRTLPMVSKVCSVPMARHAVEIMLGMTLDEMDLPRRLLPHYAIRSSLFPFDTFSETDPLPGPRMASTGQAMVMADVFGMACFSSQQAAGPTLPLEGNVLITVTDADKPSILEPARLFIEMGFGIQATRGTHAFLAKNGIPSTLVKKLGFGRPDLVDGIKTGSVALVVNTPSGRQSQKDDADIRKTAIRYDIPNVTTPAAALAAAKGIAARKEGRETLRTLQSYVRALK